jgi:hypothetical protein
MHIIALTPKGINTEQEKETTIIFHFHDFPSLLREENA